MATEGVKQRSTQPSTKQGETPLPREARRQFRTSFHKTFQNFWFYVTVFVGVVTLVYTYRPQVTVTAGTTLSETDPTATLFAIANAGPWTLYNMRFECVIHDGVQTIDLHSGEAGRLLDPQDAIGELRPTDVATRDCGARSANPGESFHVSYPAVASVDVTISFNWPKWFPHEPIVKHFDTRKYQKSDKYVLVPDINYKPLSDEDRIKLAIALGGNPYPTRLVQSERVTPDHLSQATNPALALKVVDGPSGVRIACADFQKVGALWISGPQATLVYPNNPGSFANNSFSRRGIKIGGLDLAAFLDENCF